MIANLNLLAVSFAATAEQQSRIAYVWRVATVEAQVIIALLGVFSIVAWSVIAFKVIQLRRAKKLNTLFNVEFRSQSEVLAIFDRRIQVEGCPLFTVYQQGALELDARLKGAATGSRKTEVSLKAMEHVKGSLERAVAQESLKLEAGLIMLAIAVSGAPFLGLLGTVWGVMDTFTGVAIAQKPDLVAMAPGVAAALATTVAGLLVALPSMFGYNWLVHSLRVHTVELDNFAQELAFKMESEFLKD